MQEFYGPSELLHTISQEVAERFASAKHLADAADVAVDRLAAELGVDHGPADGLELQGTEVLRGQFAVEPGARASGLLSGCAPRWPCA